MPFIEEFYRRQFLDTESIHSASHIEISDALERIINSSKFLKSLQIADTEGLRSFLKQRDINLSSLFNEDSSWNTATNSEDSITEATDVKKIDGLGDALREPTKLINLSELKKYNNSLIVEIEGISKTITNFHGLTEYLLDSIFDSIGEKIASYSTSEEEKIKIDRRYKWSCIKNDNGSYDHSIFVLFYDVMMEYLFYQLANASDFRTKAKINVIFSDNFIHKIEPHIEKETKCEVDKLIIALSQSLNYFEELQQAGEAAMIATKPEDDYLTKCQKLAENYSVNPKDLAMVPLSMIEEVKKYILDFRLHVLTDLENSRNERAKRDQMKAKMESSTSGTHFGDTDINLIENGKTLSDIEYETLLQKKDKILNDKEYYIRLSKYKRKEEHRLKAIKNFIAYNKHDSYVRNVLPQNRQKFLLNFVNNVVDTNNKIDKNFNYYIKHTNYLKFRAKAKELEEKTDNQDENDELVNT